ncbi:MAG: hypothetical protein RSD63_02870 [Eubacterium sp.]
MIMILSFLALLLIGMFAILLLFAPKERLNIPIMKNIRLWLEKNRLIGYSLLFGTKIILIVIIYTHI